MFDTVHSSTLTVVSFDFSQCATGKKESLPHVNARWGHSDTKSYGSSLKLGRDPWINKLLVSCNHTQNNRRGVTRKINLANYKWVVRKNLCAGKSPPVRQQKQYRCKNVEWLRWWGHLTIVPLTFFSCGCLFSRRSLLLWCLADRAHTCQTPAAAHLTTACGHRCITCSPPLVRTRSLADLYLGKEEAFCLQDMQAAIRRQQYSVRGNSSDKSCCSFFLIHNTNQTIS